MVRIVIHELDAEAADELRIRALANDCSIEEEARDVLSFALKNRGLLPQPKNWALAIHERFRRVGIKEVVLPSRDSGEPIQFVFRDDEDDDKNRISEVATLESVYAS